MYNYISLSLVILTKNELCFHFFSINEWKNYFVIMKYDVDISIFDKQTVTFILTFVIDNYFSIRFTIISQIFINNIIIALTLKI